MLGEGPAKLALEKAKISLKRGKDALAHRQKLIKVADRSELGWAVVAEYETDGLAADSDDEKRLERAERTAERKVARKKSKADEAEKGRRSVHDLPERAKAPARWDGAGPSGLIKPPIHRPVGPILCFLCGGPGHIKRDCPRNSVVTYPFSLVVQNGVVQARAGGELSTCGEGGEELSPEGLHSKELSPDLLHSKELSPDLLHSKELSPDLLHGDELSPDLLHGDELSPDLLHGDELSLESPLCKPVEIVCKQRCWEFEESRIPELDSMAVKSRLRRHIEYWEEELHATQWIIDMIRNGYMLPFNVEPPAYRRGNKNTAYTNADFVRSAVVDLVKGGFVEEVTEQPYVCSPVSVVENSAGKKRLVVNLRHINRFLRKRKFKFEDLRIAMMLFERGELMFNFDLKSGYHHVDIAVHHRKYLGFEWEQHFYVFTVLPFGLASAPYVFTKLLRPLVKLWRSKGFKSLMYLDDGIVAVKGKESAEKASVWVKNSLQCAGFVINDSKSVWIPSHCVTWLGFSVDLLGGRVFVPQEKLEALVSLVRDSLTFNSLRAKHIASIVGKIISMGIALGPVSRFMTRNLYALLDSRSAWCDVLRVSPQARMELEFWVNCLHHYSSQPIWHSPSAVRVVYSDASDTGYGGYTVEHGVHVAQGSWSPEEAIQSSTWRELVAVSRVLISIASKLRNMRVRWFSDNQNVVRILQVGSRKPHLQEQAMKVFETCISYQIRLEPDWLPREENELADFISRIVDYDDWQVNPELFYGLDGVWGPHSVDRFADDYNSHLPRFNSRFACPRSEAVDAFTVDWGGGENNWWCPPPGLVVRVVRHAEVCHATGTLIVPYWKSAPFWPLLCPDGSRYASFVVDFRVLPALTREGRSGGNLFGEGRPSDSLLALRLGFI